MKWIKSLLSCGSLLIIVLLCIQCMLLIEYWLLFMYCVQCDAKLALQSQKHANSTKKL